MEFSSEIIDKIYDLAKKLTPVEDIAVLLGINEDLLSLAISNKTTPAHIAYFKGKAETALELRTQQLELARVGSPVAVQLLSSYIRDISNDDI